MNAYLEMQTRHQEEMNAFPMFAAFNEAQFEEGMKKLGLKPTNMDAIQSVGYAMFIRKKDSPAFREMCHRHYKEQRDAIASDLSGEGFIQDMFIAEMGNHEYGYTMDLTDTLHALQLTISEINNSPALRRGLALAQTAVFDAM
jgi:hypothetical protein